IDIPYASALDGHAHGPAPTARRATVTIGVSHDCDPEALQEPLAEAARRSGLKVDGEDAAVEFEDIGDTALNFSVSVPLTDGVSTGEAETALRTQAVKKLREGGSTGERETGLRTQAVKTLRERGINLASPQRQVRLRDLEGLRAFLVRLPRGPARRRGAGARGAGQTPAPTH